MNIKKFIDPLSITFGFLALVSLGGCFATTFSQYTNTETAQRLAAPAWMIKRDISASPFVLRAYERIHEKGSFANLYIEGDGIKNGFIPSVTPNPTPTNPVGLHLATKDKAENLVYLARPCQYTGMIDVEKPCDPVYFNDKKFSPDVIDAYNTALNNIKRQYDIRGFHLIGYSGGAAIAALLAAQRDDVQSLRTVAGVLDTDAYHTIHGKAPLTDSFNPAQQASDLTKMPQYHFVGGQDAVVPPSVLHSYLQGMPPSTCVQTLLVQEASHDAGWVEKWPDLLTLKPECGIHGEQTPLPESLPYVETSKPYFKQPKSKTPVSADKPEKP
ncbi:MAG: hypothetical protein GC137_08690 [Alphaproteobacteria bacterium]|nr:hypothetical protein [Alphaproteobacteria bacterium]